MSKRNKIGMFDGLGHNACKWGTLSPIEMFYYSQIKKIQLTRFEWSGIPEDSYIDPKMIETILFDYGTAVFSFDEILGFTILWCAFTGDLDIYSIPRSFEAYGINGYRKHVTAEDGVLIFDSNEYFLPGSYGCFYYAKRLAAIEQSIITNLLACRTPVVLQVPANEKLAIENAFKKVENNDPVLVVTDELDLKSAIKSINTSAPYLVDKLQAAKQSVWDECMLFLGFDNSSNEKKERLLVDEVESNNDQLAGYRFAYLDSRKRACEKINDMFGLSISVDWRKQSNAGIILDTTQEPETEETEEEGEEE